MTIIFFTLILINLDRLGRIFRTRESKQHFMSFFQVIIIFILNVNFRDLHFDFYLLFDDLYFGSRPQILDLVLNVVELTDLILNGEIDFLNRIVFDGIKFAEVCPKEAKLAQLSHGFLDGGLITTLKESYSWAFPQNKLASFSKFFKFVWASSMAPPVSSTIFMRCSFISIFIMCLFFQMAYKLSIKMTVVFSYKFLLSFLNFSHFLMFFCRFSKSMFAYLILGLGSELVHKTNLWHRFFSCCWNFFLNSAFPPSFCVFQRKIGLWEGSLRWFSSPVLVFLCPTFEFYPIL